MKVEIAYCTDRGIKKTTNQDALLLKTADTPRGKVGLFVVCDGMGGLAQGELASATVVRGLSDWFSHDLPAILERDEPEKYLEADLQKYIQRINEKIFSYGEASRVQLGTTVTALLFVSSTYYLVHIGDSRAYFINQEVKQLTKDQTLVALEVERGNLTEGQAIKDPRRNILLQCVGATREVEAVITSGRIQSGTYMLCTDGFYHQMTTDELVNTLQPKQFINEQQMGEAIGSLVELVKMRKETDNISVILIKVTAEEFS